MNIRDIARIAEVTPGTVSKVLNNYPDISEATRQHVLKIIAENQYDPKEKAKAKKNALAPRVGMVVESVYNPFYSVLEDSLSIYFHNAGLTEVAFHDNFFAQDKLEKFNELLSLLEPEKLSGLVYIGGDFESLSIDVFNKLTFPTIFINTRLPYPTGKPVYSSVQISHAETARAQMQYLIEQGHRHICTIISSTIDTSAYSLRYQAYREVLINRGLEHNLAGFIETDYQYAKAYQNVLSYFTAHPEVTAICSGTDTVIPAVLRALRDAGKTPGEDVKIISFDGLPHMKYCIPSISTFEQPTDEIVKHVSQLMFGLLQHERNHQHITFQPAFKQRESS